MMPSPLTITPILIHIHELALKAICSRLPILYTRGPGLPHAELALDYHAYDRRGQPSEAKENILAAPESLL
jgi:hypothetical protein